MGCRFRCDCIAAALGFKVYKKNVDYGMPIFWEESEENMKRFKRYRWMI